MSSATLYAAARSGHADVVRVLLEAGAEVERGDYDGTTPLMVAAESGSMETVEVLVGAGADVNRWIGGGNPLSNAALGGHRAVYEFLAPLTDDDSFSVLMRTAYHGHLDCVRYLLEIGAVRDKSIFLMGTALDYAHRGKREGHYRGQPYDEVIRVLEEAGVPAQLDWSDEPG
ncbi:ankyrin repeat domain-containing protein [Haliangium sp.]|uniref:ankyrin repeat domain-containing protein n=1 Tax=Haliangium sp. TaxID=2663208 RepID=UPI003D0A4AB7